MFKKWLSIILMITTLVFLLGVVSASAAPQESESVHIVRRGETLSMIAQRYGVNMWVLARANGITNPNRIYVGQRLVIPAASYGSFVHIVRRGETLLGIAIRYGVNVWTIAQANGITNLNHIFVGQRLIIPGKAPASQPPPQPSYPVTWPGPWTGEYFDNISLTAPAYVQRTDAQINLDWGYGPPAGGMPTNAFSVRWTGTFNFDGGTYRFYARVDDGVRVYVDGVQIINGWRDGALRTYYADRSLTAGNHTVQVEFYDRIQVARIYFWYKKIAGPTPTPTPTSPQPTGAWYGEYFNGQGLSGNPVFTRYDPHIGFDWGTDSPAPTIWQDHFSIRWTQTAYFKTDHYRFCARVDDGVRIYVDDQKILDAWHGNNAVTHCASYHLNTGNHTVKVEYYEDGGNALIFAWWEPH